jgi:hypothetical protein
MMRKASTIPAATIPKSTIIQMMLAFFDAAPGLLLSLFVQGDEEHDMASY